MELILAEKKKIVIEMYLKQENRRNIAKTVHLSFSTISKIINEYEGQKQPKPEKSNTAKAFSLFEDGASLNRSDNQIRYSAFGSRENIY